LTVERVGGWITLWVNGVMVERVYDDQLMGERLVGIMTYKGHDVQYMYFDNFLLCIYR
jgi:hypothetical protein